MIKHTKAFKIYKDLSQAHLNFVVLTCHAVPFLKTKLQSPAAPALPAPDYFKGGGNTIPAMLGFIANYQEELARSTLITVFSYFESYLKSALIEVVDFHGGPLAFRQKARDRAERFFRNVPPAVQESKRKLQDTPTLNKRAKYQKHAELLETKGFRFPTDLLSHFGVAQLIVKADPKRGFKAHEIPSILKETLLFPLTTAQEEMLERVRVNRNKIAHGAASPVTLANSLREASNLHAVAAAVDRHIADHFLLIQQP